MLHDVLFNMLSDPPGVPMILVGNMLDMEDDQRYEVKCVLSNSNMM